MAKKNGWTDKARAKARRDGRKGGLIGGKARAAKLSAEERHRIAKLAVKAREQIRKAR